MKNSSPIDLIVSSRQAAPSERRLNTGFVFVVLFLGLISYFTLALIGVHNLLIPLNQDIKIFMAVINSTLTSFALPSFGKTVQQWREIDPDATHAQVYAIWLCSAVSLALTGLTLVALRRKSIVDSLIHIKGGQLFEGKDATQKLTKLFKNEYKFSGIGLAIHPTLNMPLQRENQNALIVGAVGSGKTQFMLPITNQIVKSKTAKSIIFDYKGDYTEHFLSNENVGLLAPWDARTLEWNIREDVRNHNDALLFAQAIIPEPSGNADPMWTQGSRAILTGCIMAAIDRKPDSWSWKTLSRILSCDIEKLAKIMELHYPRAAHLLDKGSKTSSSFFQTLQTYCQPIFNLANDYDPKAKQFSIRSWLNADNSQPSHIILQHSTEMAPTAKANAELLLYFASRYLLAAPDDTTRQVYFLLDETAHLSFKQLPELISTGRSKGARVFIGVQDLGLLAKQFSDAEINAIASMIGLTVSFRLSSMSKFTKQVSEGLGKQVIERLNTTTTSQGETSQSWQQQEQPIVSEADLMGLPQAGKKGVFGYLSFAGTNIVAKLNWPITSLPKNTEAHRPKQRVEAKHKKQNQSQLQTNVVNAYEELLASVSKEDKHA